MSKTVRTKRSGELVMLWNGIESKKVMEGEVGKTGGYVRQNKKGKSAWTCRHDAEVHLTKERWRSESAESPMVR